MRAWVRVYVRVRVCVCVCVCARARACYVRITNALETYGDRTRLETSGHLHALNTSPPRQQSRYPPNRRPEGPDSRSGQWKTVPPVEIQSLGRPSRSVVTLLTATAGLSEAWNTVFRRRSRWNGCLPTRWDVIFDSLTRRRKSLK